MTEAAADVREALTLPVPFTDSNMRNMRAALANIHQAHRTLTLKVY